MSAYLLLKWIHIIGSTVLLGTGVGIAFFMLMAHRSGDINVIAHTARTVVIADWVFTATAVLLQPISGTALAYMAGWPLSSLWIWLSAVLYILIGLCWIPVVWIQLKMRNLSAIAHQQAIDLPASYHRLFRTWFALGIPAFLLVLVIFWLMIAKPV